MVNFVTPYAAEQAAAARAAVQHYQRAVATGVPVNKQVYPTRRFRQFTAVRKDDSGKLLICPHIRHVPLWPHRYACATPHEFGQAACHQCGGKL